MTPEYIAGFFDGEGCVRITRHTTHGTYDLRVEIALREDSRRVLDALRGQYGGAIYGNPKNRSAHWTLAALSAARFLIDIEPHLILKRDQVRLALEFQARKKPAGHAGVLTDAEKGIRAVMAADLKAMKQYRFDVKA